MRYDEFRRRIINHLEKYNPGNGVYSERWKKTYRHIVAIPEGWSKRKVICDIIQSDGVNPDLYSKPQQFAHHLNSSQVVCYEFFRSMINPDSTPTESLVRFVGSVVGVTVSGSAHCDFEYNEPYYGVNGKRERTEFDFHIKDDTTGVELFFEIKYTEQDFGPWDKTHATEQNFLNFYAPLIEKCTCLKSKPAFDDDFVRHYQLFRNVLRVDGRNRYSIFLYPGNNEKTESQYSEFAQKYLKDTDHVKSVHWEDVEEFMTENFRSKFFVY